MDMLGPAGQGSLVERGWYKSVAESSSSHLASVTIDQTLDEWKESRNKLSTQSYKGRKNVPGSGGLGSNETQGVSGEFVIRWGRESGKPVGAEGLSGGRENWVGSG